MWKHVQASKGKVLTTPEMLKDYKRKSKHSKPPPPKKIEKSKECHKDLG